MGRSSEEAGNDRGAKGPCLHGVSNEDGGGWSCREGAKRPEGGLRRSRKSAVPYRWTPPVGGETRGEGRGGGACASPRDR